MKYIENNSPFHLGESYSDDPPSTLLSCGNIYQKRKKKICRSMLILSKT